MKKETSNFIAEKKQLTARLAEIQSEVEQLPEKTASLKKTLTELSDAVNGLDREKRTMLADFISNKRSEFELDDIDDKKSRAQRRIIQITEVLDKIPHALRDLQEEKNMITNRIMTCDRDIWQQITAEIKTEVGRLLGDQLVRAYGAYQLGYSGLDFRLFLGNFFETPGLDDVMRLQQEIAQKHGVTI